MRLLLKVLVGALLGAPVAGAEELLKQHVGRPLDAEATMAALEPWETPLEGFFIRSHFDLPSVEADRWTVVIDGLVDHPLTLSLADLQKLPQISLHAVLECSGNGRALQEPKVGGVPWERGAFGNGGFAGVSLKALLEKAGVQPEGHYLTAVGADKPALPSMPGFIRSIPIAKALADDTLLATGMNGGAIPILHGGPLRLILPNWYGENWVKWVTRLTVTAAEDHGFYMKKAYRVPKKPVKPGETWDPATGVTLDTLPVQSYIVVPKAGETVAKGKVTVKGKTFSGSGPVTAVDLSLDGGKSWQKAVVEARHKDGGWQEFTAELPIVKLGAQVLWSRAKDKTGAVQPLDHTWNPSGYARNAVDQVKFKVGEAAVADGREVMHSRCVTCHTTEMIEAQRLKPAQWLAEVEKMQKVYGASLTPLEQRSLLSYLEMLSPDLPRTAPPPLVYGVAAAGFGDEVVLPPGDAAQGASLFANFCASCHGPAGDGQIGPRLHGRALGGRDFRLTVLYGRHTMPAFAASLSAQDLADLRVFLRQ